MQDGMEAGMVIITTEVITDQDATTILAIDIMLHAR